MRRNVYVKNSRGIRLIHNGVNEIMILMAAAVKLNRDLHTSINLIKNKQ